LARADAKIPGLPEILSSLTYQSHPGLLGICLSGAGPTILALATENFDAIAQEIKRIFKSNGVEVDWELLSVYEEGSWVKELSAGNADQWVKDRS
jgi:homoserine kinase